jgi:hypothetical protein
MRATGRPLQRMFTVSRLRCLEDSSYRYLHYLYDESSVLTPSPLSPGVVLRLDTRLVALIEVNRRDYSVYVTHISLRMMSNFSSRGVKKKKTNLGTTFAPFEAFSNLRFETSGCKIQSIKFFIFMSSSPRQCRDHANDCIFSVMYVFMFVLKIIGSRSYINNIIRWVFKQEFDYDRIATTSRNTFRLRSESPQVPNRKWRAAKIRLNETPLFG